MSKQGLVNHLKSGPTHVCQCWAVTRKDGATFGFTDHDSTLRFDGIDFVADSGMSAKALAATTGIAVNNTEAMGLLRSDSISEADIVAGRYDDAAITSWLVQWDNVANRRVRFRGTMGEITRQSGQFEAELRGITEALNQPLGRSYLRCCSAVLGDGACRFNLNSAAFRLTTATTDVDGNRVFGISGSSQNDRWFEQGKLTILTGPAMGLTGAIKHDRRTSNGRIVTLWHAIRADVLIGDEIRLDAGCDKRAETCRVKFDNLVNFQGFPDMPGEDWLMSVPRTSDDSDGGSLVR